MTQEPLDPYIGALRGDLPSAADEARLRRKLLAVGLGLSVAFATKTAAAGAGLGKTGIVASLASRFMNLSLLSQFSVVTAATTVALTAPVWIAAQSKPPTASGISSQSAPPPARRAASLDPEPRAVPVELGQRVVSPVPATIETPGNDTRRTSAAVKAERREATTVTNSLAEETQLLDGALGALREGDLARATAYLDEHQSRFPQGKLTRERQRARQKLSEAERHYVQ